MVCCKRNYIVFKNWSLTQSHQCCSVWARETLFDCDKYETLSKDSKLPFLIPGIWLLAWLLFNAPLIVFLRRHHYWWRGCKHLGRCLAPMTYEKGGIFIVPHLFCQGASGFPVSFKGPPYVVAWVLRIYCNSDPYGAFEKESKLLLRV